ncbi:hypothetical protein [Verminephrobacter eiseniae]|uniref:hypothetical protein n=1 Tax=Verminephrobacter eiseniae TaxID=364317 RepID=UPI0022381E09|nr:hypothetical protein [Verminephrobacter eiseniae]
MSKSLTDSSSKSFVNAKAERRQYECTASDAGKVHGCFGSGMSIASLLLGRTVRLAQNARAQSADQQRR